MEETFKLIDKDGNGLLCPAEINDVLTTLIGEISVEKVQEMIKTVDKNKDGKISYKGIQK